MGYMARQEKQDTLSESMRQRWQDPEYREKMTAAMREAQQRPEIQQARQNEEARARRSEAAQKAAIARWNDPASRDRTPKPGEHQRRSEAAQKSTSARWSDPESRANMLAAMRSPAARTNRSNAAKKKWQNESYRGNQIMAITAPEVQERRSKASRNAALRRNDGKKKERTRVKTYTFRKHVKSPEREIWDWANDHQLIQALIREGYISSQEAKSLKLFFQGKLKRRPEQELLERFTIGVANLA